jgi:hypothetical protein
MGRSLEGTGPQQAMRPATKGEIDEARYASYGNTHDGSGNDQDLHLLTPLAWHASKAFLAAYISIAWPCWAASSSSLRASCKSRYFPL